MNGKAIFNSYIAKQLLLLGNEIVDLQPDKMRNNGIIFYFKITEKLIKDIQSLSRK